jgi:hypothetical protein
VLQEFKERLEFKVLLASLEQWDPSAHKVYKARRVLLAQLDCRVIKEVQV